MHLFRFAVLLFAALLGLAQPAFADSKTKPVLFLMTSNAELFGTGKKTGVWLSSVAVPYYALKQAGFAVSMASINGLTPPIDPRSNDEKNPANARFLADKDAMQMFHNAAPLADLKSADYSAIYMPGGHGVMWDHLDNQALTRLLWHLYSEGKIIAALDHAPMALFGINDKDNKSILPKLKIAAFTKAEEVQLHFENAVPTYPDLALEMSGAVMVLAPPFKPSAVHDGQIITGQNPQSVDRLTALLIKALKKQSAK